MGNHPWFPGEQWQCPACTGFTSQFTRLEFLDSYDARFVIVTHGPIEEALAYKRRVGNTVTWYFTANCPFGSDVGAPPGGGFPVGGCFQVMVLPHERFPKTRARGRIWCRYRAPCRTHVACQTVRRASVGDSRAARRAGSRPAIAPVATAAATPPAQAVVGTTTAQCLALA